MYSSVPKHGPRRKPITERTTTVFGDAPITPFSTRQYLFDKCGISNGLDKENMLGSTLWLGITESDSEIIKEGDLLGFKDNIIKSDILWATDGSLDFIFDGIWAAHYLVFMTIPKLENNLVLSKINCLMYLIDLLKAHLKKFSKWWKTWTVIS